MMQFIKRRWMVLAFILIAAGIVFTCFGVVLGGTPVYSLSYNSIDKFRLATQQQKREEVVLEKTRIDAYTGLNVKVDFMAVSLIEGDDFYIEYSSVDGKLEYDVSKGTLTVKKPSTGYIFSWGFSTGFTAEDYNAPYLNLYIPAGTDLKNLKITTDTGDVHIEESISTGALDIKADFGDIKTGIIDADKAVMEADTGNISVAGGSIDRLTMKSNFGRLDLGDMEAKEVQMTTDTGEMKLDNLTADSVTLTTSFGDISGNSVQTGYLKAKVETGECTLMDLTADKVDIVADFGSVNLGLTGGLNDYSFRLSTDFGSVKLNKEERGDDFTMEQNGGIPVEVTTDTGEIVIDTK